MYDTKVFVYESEPQDFWIGWKSLDDLNADGECLRFGSQRISQMLLYIGSVVPAYEYLRHGPMVSTIPRGECEGALIVAVKLDNNGTTYFASEVELPSLGTPKLIASVRHYE